MRSIAVVVVSHNSAGWLPACLDSVVAAAGGVDLDLVVVDSGSSDSTSEVVGAHAAARLVTCENDGFAHANNHGAAATDASWLFFLNPDTRIVAGTLSDLLDVAEQLGVGIAGVRQIDADGRLEPSMRRFPRPSRWLGEALGSERWPLRPAWSGERMLESAPYEHEAACDWTSGSAMLVRSGLYATLCGMDERFFLYCEEPDLSLRARSRGETTMHLPALTVVHYGGNEATSERLARQLAFSRRLYARKHFGPAGRVAGTLALAFGYGLRLVAGPRRRQALAGLVTVLGRFPEPFRQRGR